MRHKHPVAALVGLSALVLSSSVPVPALASPAPSQPVAERAASHRARASLRLDTGTTRPWVGQPVPVTVTAFFRDVEGVTLEGAPQLRSKAIITSDLVREPRQSTELVDGARTLVVRWTGSVTPSTTGPLDLSVELPVRIRYRDAAPAVAQRRDTQGLFDGDPFSALGNGGSIDDIFDRMQKRMLERMDQPEGQVREQDVPLSASAKALDVRALPTDARPPTFTGAVGQFDIEGSVSSANVRVSEPVTVRIAVGGTIDLDRVDLPGIASSDAWKAYPPRVLERPPGDAKGAPRKIFEQVIVPLHGGELTVPSVSFTAFDPATGTYVTHGTKPIPITVDGPSAPAPAPAPAPAAPPAAAPPAPDSPLPADVAPLNGPVSVATPRQVGLRVAPVLAFVALAGVLRLLRRRKGEWSLRRAMRHAAARADVGSFVRSAHDLISRRLSVRWAMSPEDVTARTVQQRLGPDGQPLVDVLVARETMRFAGGDVAGNDPGIVAQELGKLCAAVERSLRGAT